MLNLPSFLRVLFLLISATLVVSIVPGHGPRAPPTGPRSMQLASAALTTRGAALVLRGNRDHMPLVPASSTIGLQHRLRGGGTTADKELKLLSSMSKATLPLVVMGALQFFVPRGLLNILGHQEIAGPWIDQETWQVENDERLCGLKILALRLAM